MQPFLFFNKQFVQTVLLSQGFLLRILEAGERCNITGEYFGRGSTSE